MIKPIYNEVTPIFQPKDSNICGPTSLYVVAKYFGVDVGEYQSFIDGFAYEGEGTYLPQLGTKALELGLKAEIIMFNPHLFSIADMVAINPLMALENAKDRWADDNFVYVTDSALYDVDKSLQAVTGRYKHTHDQFIYAIHAATHADIDNGGILVVSKQ